MQSLQHSYNYLSSGCHRNRIHLFIIVMVDGVEDFIPFIPINGVLLLLPEVRVYVEKSAFGGSPIWTRRSSELPGWVFIQPSIVIEGVGSGIRLSGLRSQLHHFLAVCDRQVT